jgi:hypothetical protein
MKKFLVILGLAGVGYALYRKFAADQGEAGLWSEVADPVD